MAGTAVATLVNGVWRGTSVQPYTAIYDQSITIVASGATGNQLNGPISASTPITLPSSGSYTVSSSIPNLNIHLNGDRLEYSFDWNTSGSGPNFTAVTFTFTIAVGDRIDFRTERSS